MLQHQHTTPMPPQRVVLLGANGFVGRRLTAALQAAGVATLSLGRGDIDLVKPEAGAGLAGKLQPDDALVFLSILTPDKGKGLPAFEANLAIGLAVARALEKAPVAHVVYFGSDAIYPFGEPTTNEQSLTRGSDLYAAAHLARESLVASVTKAPVAILRPTLIYGAGDTHNSYGPNRFIRAARGDGRIALFGEGEETRDHIAVEDVVALTRLVLDHRSAGTLNLATGQSIAYGELARKVAALSPTPVRVEPSPRQNPITHRRFDVAALQQAFPGFMPTPLDAGLSRAWREWASQ
jgi:UDP-glucose 4-epimerase